MSISQTAPAAPAIPANSPRVHHPSYALGRAEVLAAIRDADRILVSSHARPDGDAIGSMLACAMMLDQMGKQVSMVSSDRVPLLYRWLPCADEIHHQEQLDGAYDLIILLECDSLERSRLQGLEDRKVVNIDHHASGRPFGAVNWIEPEASAVAEMVFDLATAANVRITPGMATCLYTAVLTDTGSFCYRGTDAHTLRLAAELVRLGADPATIAQQVYFSNPLSKMALLGSALSTLQRDGRIAWLWVTYDDMLRNSAAEEDCEGIVNYAISIAGVDVAAFLRELPDGWVRLSLRSKGTVDVARLAEQFGGGGHTNASGCTLAGPLHDAQKKILHLLRGLAQ